MLPAVQRMPGCGPSIPPITWINCRMHAPRCSAHAITLPARPATYCLVSSGSDLWLGCVVYACFQQRAEPRRYLGGGGLHHRGPSYRLHRGSTALLACDAGRTIETCCRECRPAMALLWSSRVTPTSGATCAHDCASIPAPARLLTAGVAHSPGRTRPRPRPRA